MHILCRATQHAELAACNPDFEGPTGSADGAILMSATVLTR